MNMKKYSWLFYLLIIVGLFVMLFSIFDIIYAKDLIYVSIGLYCAIIVIIFLMIFFGVEKKEEQPEITIEEFEKRLKGGLYHFKCPTCHGIFAVKKSKGNNKKYVKMACPDCGALGVIPPNPAQIEAVIPEKKSLKANFKCNNCGEGVTVWAEGSELNKNVNVYSCPFCGVKEPLKRI